jgi:toxin ParE1/3/4
LRASSPITTPSLADLIVRAEAETDLLDIYARSVQQFGEKVAQDYLFGIDRALNRLAEFLESGPIYARLRPPVRFLLFKRHHIIYDYDGATVWIIRILHHAQDIGRVF